jgi:hypothetical protein
MTDEANTQQDAAAATAEPAVNLTPVNEYVTMQPSAFHFKTDKVRDEAGKVIGEGKKHPSVTIPLPIPKTTRLIEFLSDPTKYAKEVELLMASAAATVFQVARGQINDFREKNPEGVVTPGVINYDALDFTAIANMPKSERGSFVPADEDIKAFLDSYLEIMPAATNKTPEKIKNHVDIISTGFKKQRAQKDVLELFKDAFSIYITKAPTEVVEEHVEVIEYFNNRLDRMLKVEEKITMDDL